MRKLQLHCRKGLNNKLLILESERYERKKQNNTLSGRQRNNSCVRAFC